MPHNLKSAASHSYTCTSAAHSFPRHASSPVRLGKLLELIAPVAPKCSACGSRMVQTGMTFQMPLDPTWVRPNLWAQAKAALASLTS